MSYLPLSVWKNPHRQCCDPSSAFYRTTIKSMDESDFVKIPSPIMELAPLENLKNSDHSSIYFFLIGSPSFFHVTRTFIKAWMSLKFCRIGPGAYELTALVHLQISP